MTTELAEEPASAAPASADAGADGGSAHGKVFPKWIECWRTDRERKMGKEREKWMNRPTFILASIGAAVGLGNFWRFPYLTNKYGGGFFFVPYLLALFTMGIPLLLMELSLGQKF